MRKNSPSRNKKSRRSDLDQSRNRGPHRGAPPGRVFDDRRPKDSMFFDVFFHNFSINFSYPDWQIYVSQNKWLMKGLKSSYPSGLPQTQLN